MNIAIIAAIIVGLLWAMGLFLGVIGGTSKAFKDNPSPTINSKHIKAQSEESIRSTEEKRQRLMDDMKQKISDSNRRY
jgi:hypothetical protein